MMRSMLLAWALTLAAPALAADANSPHPHQGVIGAFSGKPAKPALTESDIATLSTGKPVLKQIREGKGGRGIAVQDVHATPEQVWSRITSYGNYPEWVDNVKECAPYATEGEHLKVRFVISALMVNVEYYIDHIYAPDQGYMTWSLDYTRESDLDDSVGFWVVEPIADKPGWTRVFYSVDVRIKGWVPKAIENMIAKQGLTKATSWVKRESEAVAGTAD